jgi:long-chain fatty acid transport protein
MKIIVATAGALALGTQAAMAAHLDQTGESSTPLFVKGNYAEFSFGYASPSVSGVQISNGASVIPPLKTGGLPKHKV